MRMITGIVGATKPSEHIAGPTGCWHHYNVERIVEDDNVSWRYDGIWFELGEHEMVENGQVPGGIAWTKELHALFRQAQHRRTDDLYNLAYRCKRSSATPDDWTAYIDALDAWNSSVSALATDFSTLVPELPPMPA